jgi:hypothetical protein
MGEMADYYSDYLNWDSVEDHSDVFCKYCHRGPFDWKKGEDGRWRLYTQERGKVHHCSNYLKVRRKALTFDKNPQTGGV